MATPTLTPSQTTSAIALPQTASLSDVTSTSLPFNIYNDDTSPLYSDDFITGAVDQVAYTYKKLGGDVLDLELTKENVFASYEESVLEYSYILNIHQAKNVLGDMLGNTTGTFNHDGNLINEGSLSSSLGEFGESGHKHASLSYPSFRFEYSKKVGLGVGAAIGVGGDETEYSASFDTEDGVQDYDLQSIISSSAESSGLDYSGLVGSNKITVKQVFYKTPHAMWRFFGYYGGLNTVGNMQNYGQYADDSQFQIVPVWQNKQQAMSFEDSIYTRNSQYAFELKNNKLRLFPNPTSSTPSKMWIKFTVKRDAWEEYDDKKTGAEGVNNMNTLPFANIPYRNINSIGKQWIRRFALSLSKETLGQVRSKFGSIPIPGESVSLNGDALITQAKEEQDKLREELKTVLDEMTYAKLAERDAAIADSVNKFQEKIPLPVFTG